MCNVVIVFVVVVALARSQKQSLSAAILVRYGTRFDADEVTTISTNHSAREKKHVSNLRTCHSSCCPASGGIPCRMKSSTSRISDIITTVKAVRGAVYAQQTRHRRGGVLPRCLSGCCHLQRSFIVVCNAHSNPPSKSFPWPADDSRLRCPFTIPVYGLRWSPPFPPPVLLGQVCVDPDVFAHARLRAHMQPDMQVHFDLLEIPHLHGLAWHGTSKTNSWLLSLLPVLGALLNGRVCGS